VAIVEKTGEEVENVPRKWKNSRVGRSQTPSWSQFRRSQLETKGLGESVWKAKRIVTF
jgi:hypothetical protein